MSSRKERSEMRCSSAGLHRMSLSDRVSSQRVFINFVQVDYANVR